MKLTEYTDYAFRVLMYLGIRNRGELSTISEISERYAISRNHVMKVVYELGQRNYIETVRGRNGGIRLNRAPEDITVGEIVRHFEHNLALVECFGTHNTCCLKPVCELRGMLGEALEAFLAVLDRYTLADLIQPRSGLARQLRLLEPI